MHRRQAREKTANYKSRWEALEESKPAYTLLLLKQPKKWIFVSATRLRYFITAALADWHSGRIRAEHLDLLIILQYGLPKNFHSNDITPFLRQQKNLIHEVEKSVTQTEKTSEVIKTTLQASCRTIISRNSLYIQMQNNKWDLAFIKIITVTSTHCVFTWATLTDHHNYTGSQAVPKSIFISHLEWRVRGAWRGWEVRREDKREKHR